MGLPLPSARPSPDAPPDAVPVLIDEWHRTLLARRMADAKSYRAKLVRVAEACRWSTLADATVRSLSRWYGEFAPGRPSSTVANYLSALVKFFAWAQTLGLIDHNPAKAIEPPPFERGDGSRACTPEEFIRLVVSTRAMVAGAHGGHQSSRDDQYVVSAYAGLRRLELAKLRVRMFEDGVPAFLAMEAGVAKGKKRKAVRIPLHEEAAEVLRRLCRGRGPDEPIFKSKFVNKHTFSKDLARAGIAEVDARGKKLTFHGLRKTFATNMARYGVNQRAAQALMRHADPKMTAMVYQDAELLPLAEELAKVPTLARMGGGGARVIHNLATLKTSLDNGPASDHASARDTMLSSSLHQDSRNPLAAAAEHGVATIITVAGGFGLSQSLVLPMGGTAEIRLS